MVTSKLVKVTNIKKMKFKHEEELQHIIVFPKYYLATDLPEKHIIQ